MPREGYRSVTLKAETADLLERLAKRERKRTGENITLPELIHRLADEAMNTKRTRTK